MSAEDLFTEDDVSTVSATPSQIDIQTRIPREKSGTRLDQTVAEMFPEYSRSRLQQWIKAGSLKLDDKIVKPNVKLVGNEMIRLTYTELPRGEWLAEPIPLDIVYEDDELLVINKPVGLVVHPAAGNYTGTLLNGLLHHNCEQAHLARAGIVHRLDKDTSGLMVVAKTELAQNRLVQQLQARTVSRQYRAIVQGDVNREGIVDQPIGRHPTHRTKMAVTAKGKDARTHYSPLSRFGDFTLLNLKLETGRTHQIRVHMAHLGYPLVGDQTYGGKLPAKLVRSYPMLQSLVEFPRQALHAWRLGLEHPATGEACAWEVELPEDMRVLVNVLKEISDVRKGPVA